jgi:hypothetical protein
MSRLDDLKEIAEALPAEQKNIIAPLLSDIDFMESRLASLRALPHIKVHPKDPSKQRITPAGKQYKEVMQSYLNAMKVIISALNKTETSAADELLKKLEEFE